MENEVIIDKKGLQLWIKALRSGEYQQTTKRLQDEIGYCCLGVACKVLIPMKNLEFNDRNGFLIGKAPYDQRNSPEWLSKISAIVDSKINHSLIWLNDAEKYTFDEIADVLELLFIHKVLD